MVKVFMTHHEVHESHPMNVHQRSLDVMQHFTLEEEESVCFAGEG